MGCQLVVKTSYKYLHLNVTSQLKSRSSLSGIQI